MTSFYPCKNDATYCKIIQILKVPKITIDSILIEDETGLYGNKEVLKNLTDDVAIIDRVIKYCKIKNKDELLKYLYTKDSVLFGKSSDDFDLLHIFQYIDNVYIKNPLLNKLISFDKGQFYFTQEAKLLVEKYELKIESTKFLKSSYPLTSISNIDETNKMLVNEFNPTLLELYKFNVNVGYNGFL